MTIILLLWVIMITLALILRALVLALRIIENWT
jgi:hypothetical protein